MISNVTSFSPSRPSAVQGKRIVLDPGHGGKDPGAIGPGGTRESDVVLTVAKEVQRLLEEQGALIRMTRTTDAMVEAPAGQQVEVATGDDIAGLDVKAKEDLANRVAIANRWPSELFVSFHCNSAENKDARGTETFVRKAETAADRKAAAAIQKHVLAEVGLKDRKVKNADYYVIKNTNSAATLVELGFLSNATEEQILANPDTQKKFAKAIADGITEYFAPAAAQTWNTSPAA